MLPAFTTQHARHRLCRRDVRLAASCLRMVHGFLFLKGMCVGLRFQKEKEPEAKPEAPEPEPPRQPEPEPEQPKPAETTDTRTAAAATATTTAVAAFDFTASHDDELSFKEGEKIVDIVKVDTLWWSGRIGDRTGIFPANYNVCGALIGWALNLSCLSGCHGGFVRPPKVSAPQRADFNNKVAAGTTGDHRSDGDSTSCLYVKCIASSRRNSRWMSILNFANTATGRHWTKRSEPPRAQFNDLRGVKMCLHFSRQATHSNQRKTLIVGLSTSISAASSPPGADRQATILGPSTFGLPHIKSDLFPTN
ncbi:unnamed protein product [Mesocestoides corti]|uniref:SH3 domain-containing protein n=1 Tax=Mesocestoides corti TaxID=53468 RepID=A0A0R3ULT5_MESCO|nr:unnamed protein product [Mesocestoides corti]